MSLIPSVRSLASKRFTYCFKLVAVILLLGKIMSTYSRYTEKGSVYIIIIALSSRQPSSYTKYIKSNIYSSYNIRLVSNTKYIFFARYYTL